MKAFRCWWCSAFIAGKGRDCGQKDCIKTRRSGAWKKGKKK